MRVREPFALPKILNEEGPIEGVLFSCVFTAYFFDVFPRTSRLEASKNGTCITDKALFLFLSPSPSPSRWLFISLFCLHATKPSILNGLIWFLIKVVKSLFIRFFRLEFPSEFRDAQLFPLHILEASLSLSQFSLRRS